MSTNDVVFLDDLPEPEKGQGARPKYQDFEDALRANPGRWAVAPQEKHATARSWAKRRELQVALRGGVTYVRAPA